MAYLAFGANPNTYDIERAIRERKIDSWETKGRIVHKGDRVIMWKFQGGGKHRGVVAFAEVLTEPELGIDFDHQFWADPSRPDIPANRVQIRYVLPPHVPLWFGEVPALNSLSIANATGGSVFYVTNEQWESVLASAGGWPLPLSEVQGLEEAIECYAKPLRSSQGFNPNPEDRRAIERYAMERAAAHYGALGWHVEDVSATQSYDLRCTRSDGRHLRVEVKGTSSAGDEVLLTRNEVRHAKAYYPHVSLFILADVEVTRTSAGVPVAQGGRIAVYEPWSLVEDDLEPLAFSYRVPSR